MGLDRGVAINMSDRVASNTYKNIAIPFALISRSFLLPANVTLNVAD